MFPLGEGLSIALHTSAAGPYWTCADKNSSSSSSRVVVLGECGGCRRGSSSSSTTIQCSFFVFVFFTLLLFLSFFLPRGETHLAAIRTRQNTQNSH